MVSAAGGPGPDRAAGWYWGARYTRTWLTTLAGLPLASLIAFSVLEGTPAWLVLLPLTVLIIGAVWLVPLAIVTTEGIELVLRGRVVAWSDVAAVLDPRPGDQQVRVELTDGHILTVSGVAPAAAPALRALRHTST